MILLAILPVYVQIILHFALLDLHAICAVALKKKKNQLESEMAELGSPRDLQRKELAVSEKITGLDKKLHYSNVEQVDK